MAVNTLQVLNNIYSQAVQALRLMEVDSVKQRENGQQLIKKVINNLGQLIKQLSTIKPTQPRPQPQAQADDMESLIELANDFDNIGAHATADLLDIAAFHIQNKYNNNESLERQLVSIANYFDDNNMYSKADAIEMVANIVSHKKKEPAPPIKPNHLSSLSSRYCPDHRGVMLGRISEGNYQCPIDGKIYNYETGFTNYEGQAVHGGSIANQTSSVTSYEIPHRIYDTRENIINTIN